jgi:hypothetical protein
MKFDHPARGRGLGIFFNIVDSQCITVFLAKRTDRTIPDAYVGIVYMAVANIKRATTVQLCTNFIRKSRKRMKIGIFVQINIVIPTSSGFRKFAF